MCTRRLYIKSMTLSINTPIDNDKWLSNQISKIKGTLFTEEVQDKKFVEVRIQIFKSQCFILIYISIGNRKIHLYDSRSICIRTTQFSHISKTYGFRCEFISFHTNINSLMCMVVS